MENTMISAANRQRVFYCLLLCLSVSTPATAELMQRIQAGIEGVARGMDYIGHRTGELLGPGLPLSEEAEAAFTFERTIEEQYPSGASPIVALSNEFGEVRVGVWNERLIRISAVITVGTDTEAGAEQIAQLIEARVSHSEDYLECRTLLPEIKGRNVSITVDYSVQVPRDAALIVDNFFGDVSLAGIGGMVVADVQYGGLDLQNIQGAARVRVQGEFPVHVHGLHQGGVFKLQSAQATFSDVHGALDISHFRGLVTVREPGPDVRISLSSDSGRAHIVLPPDASPDFTATVLYGRLESDLDVTRTLRGRQLLARHPNTESSQHISVHAAFSEVIVAVEGSVPETGARAGVEHKAFNDTHRDTIAIEAGDALQVTAISGNIQVEGADTDHILIEATRIVWTPSAASAMDALDALDLAVEREDGLIHLKTSVTQEDMTVFDCDAYRIDLRIQCPREVPVTIHAQEGITTVDGIGAGVSIVQHKGEVSLEHVKGLATINNAGGSIVARDCSGPVEASVRYGSVTLESIYGDIRVSATEGRTYVDAPHGDVSIRHRSGDVRILSIEPIQGNFDILVEDGNLSAFIAQESDAAINVKASHGKVQSTLPLSGAIARDLQEFFGRMNEETYTVRLETVNGDIFLN